MIHAASHFYHEKRVAWVSISMHACDPVPIVTGVRLASSAMSVQVPTVFTTLQKLPFCLTQINFVKTNDITASSLA